ncbi:MAG TPA: hypothetical protein VGM27_29665 [Acidobacteriaceae bacterium]|jgi:hypothetical protein
MAFLDFPKRNPPQALLPSPEIVDQLIKAGLPAQVISDMILADRREKFRYALILGVSGAICFLALIASFVLLVMHGHDTAAGIILGTAVLAIIRTMLTIRLG